MEEWKLLLTSKKKKESHLDEQDCERQTTKPNADNFGALFDDGNKLKIACLSNGFKVWCTYGDFAHNNNVILQKRSLE